MAANDSSNQPRQHIKKQRIYLANKGPSSQGYGFSSSHVWMWELGYKESWVQNWCFWTVVLKKTLESPLDCKEVQPVHPKGNQSWGHWKDWCWSWNSNTWATWCEELTHLKRPWCWERMRAGGEGDDRGWDGWMASLTQWRWVWVDSSSWWWIGRPGVLQFTGSQRVRHDWATELDWTDGHNIPGSYAILFFTALVFTSITSHIHNWVLFLLWLHLFILFGVISPLFFISILGTYWPGEFIFQCPIFLPFHTHHGVH